MPSLRTLTRRWLPLNLKRSFQHAILGYDSYAPSFSSAGEDMILRHILGSDKMSGFYAQHPGLVKTLGSAALSIALAKMAQSHQST